MFPYLDKSYVRTGDTVEVDDADDKRRRLKVVRSGIGPMGIDLETQEVVDMCYVRIRSINGFGPSDVKKDAKTV